MRLLRQLKHRLGLGLCFIGLLSVVTCRSGAESPPIPSPLFLIPVEGVIDLGLSAFVKRSIAEATAAHAGAIALQINTPGGRVDAADEIVAAVQNTADIPTFAYITDAAWSAGALIALACDTILMQPGASIGSAEPRAMGFGAGGAEHTDEKLISALRAKMKATAERAGHNPQLAEAMVDKDIELLGTLTESGPLFYTRQEWNTLPENKRGPETIVSAHGKLLNFSASEARQWGLCAELVDDETAALQIIDRDISPENSVSAHAPVRTAPTAVENLVRFLTHPIASSLLLSLGFLGILFELKIPGWGISGTLGVVFLTLFFWGHYLIGLATWLDIGLFIAGVLLLGLELFVIPGFGITGISGIVLMGAGILLGLLNHPLHPTAIQWNQAITVCALTLALSAAGIAVLFTYGPKTHLWRRLTLSDRENKIDGFSVTAGTPDGITVGTRGVADTMLRPSGRVSFGRERCIAQSAGEFISRGRPVEIVRITGNTIVVQEVAQS